MPPDGSAPPATSGAAGKFQARNDFPGDLLPPEACEERASGNEKTREKESIRVFLYKMEGRIRTLVA